jgi:hypothetical protein
MASHLQMKRGRLSWRPLFPYRSLPRRPPRRRAAAMRSRIPLNQKLLCLDLVHEDERNSMDGSHLNAPATLARRLRRAHTCHLKQNLQRMQTMPRVKQASKQKRTTKAAAVTVLGATGLGFSLLGSASASTVPAADIAQSDNTLPNQRFVLSEEEMADVSLATFHLFDKENVGSGVQLAYARGCRGCAARGCRGCAARGCAVRGCAVRGCAVRACAVGCAVGCAAGSCCASWGYCRVC